MISIKRLFLCWFRRERQSDWLFPWEREGEGYMSDKRWRTFKDVD